jgi:hypothetical protein
MGPSRWPVPPLHGLDALADLLGTDPARLAWYADTAGMQRRAGAGPLHHYRYRWLERPGRVPRLLEVPLPGLRARQRLLLDQVVGLVPADGAAHGFVPGRSAATGARVHVGAATVICLDLASFFASVTAGRVYGILRTAGYPEPVAHALTGLCCTASPVSTITAMPPGGAPGDRFALRRLLARPHLPQGAPTSPHLANLCAYRLDRRLDGYARSCGVRYTRYADDLAFSGPAELARRGPAFVAAVSRIIAAEGFRVNPAKTRIRRASDRQQVTGIVVNEHLGVTRADHDRLRAVLHNCARTGPAAQNRTGHGDFRAHLTGRVAWVESLDPRRGALLRAVLEAVDWDA